MSPTDASFLHIEGASEIVAVEVNQRPNLGSNRASNSIGFRTCPGSTERVLWNVATAMFRS